MLAILLEIMIRLISVATGSVLVILGMLGLMAVKDVFTNHLLLILLSTTCLVIGGLVAFYGTGITFRK